MRARPPKSERACAILVLAAVALAGCSDNNAPDDEINPVQAPTIPRIVPASEALAGAQIPTLDPATMNDAEIGNALGTGPYCEFRYTSYGRPILGVKALPDGAAEGVVKLNGYLVVLRSASTSGELVLVADEIRMVVAPDPEDQDDGPAGEGPQEASSVFEVGSSLRVGYRGYYECRE